MAMDGVGDIYVFDQNREQQQIDKVKQFFQAIKTVAAKASSEIFATDSTTTTSGEVSTKVATLQDRLTYFKKSLESENKAIRDQLNRGRIFAVKQKRQEILPHFKP